jgi:hypothetical protein
MVKSMKRSLGSVSLAVLSCAIGCAADVEGGNLGEEATYDDEVVSTATEALVGGWASGPYPWDQSLSRRKLPSVAGNVCVLTRLTGKFEGMGEGVRVTDDGRNWYLDGFSAQRDLAAEAYCFPRSEFQGVDGNTRVSSEYELWARGASSSCGRTVQMEMYASDAFAFLSGVQGALHGAAEYAGVFQALSTDLLSTVEARSCNAGGLSAFARSFRVGTRTERLARFALDDEQRDEFQVGDGAPSNQAVMGRTERTMCAFTRIQGKFAGGGEWVQIRPEKVDGVERWVLRSSRGAGSSYVHARARCFLRDQRTPVLGPVPGSGGGLPPGLEPL